jgi:hypothetical protein
MAFPIFVQCKMAKGENRKFPQLPMMESYIFPIMHISHQWRNSLSLDQWFFSILFVSYSILLNWNGAKCGKLLGVNGSRKIFLNICWEDCSKKGLGQISNGSGWWQIAWGKRQKTHIRIQLLRPKLGIPSFKVCDSPFSFIPSKSWWKKIFIYIVQLELGKPYKIFSKIASIQIANDELFPFSFKQIYLFQSKIFLQFLRLHFKNFQRNKLWIAFVKLRKEMKAKKD